MGMRGILLVLAVMLSAKESRGALLITEVLAGVNTTSTSGDTVEIYNSGPGAVDLTNYRLSDLDGASVETDVLNEGTFAPVSLNLPPLAVGEFAVISMVDSDFVANASFVQTNYGLMVRAPLATSSISFLGNQFEQLVLTDAAGNILDSVAWGDSGAALGVSEEQDAREDLGAISLPNSGYSHTLTNANAWAGADTFATLAEYQAAVIDVNGLTGVTTYGGGAMRRISTDTVFDEGSPDGPAQWEAIRREDATLGNFSGTVTTVSGIMPIRATGDIAEYIANLRVTFFPERRITAAVDQGPPSDFKIPDSTRQSNFTALVAKCLAGTWEEANADAMTLGYEVVEFLDTVSGITFHILRERFVPGDASFTGGGIYVFDLSPGARTDLVIQAPHPIFDSMTLAEAGLFVQQVRPMVTMISGSYKNNSTVVTPCDGTFTNGDDYRVSDAAHYDESLFHATHKHLMSDLPAAYFIQLHGFCCSVDHGITEDAVISEGFNAAPAVDSLARYWKNRINEQMFVADDGLGGDLTEAGLYGDPLTVWGATTNVQGRLLNGVTVGMECGTPATGSLGRFVHIEQDPDVREEPQHMINALLLALDDLDSAIMDWKKLDD